MTTAGSPSLKPILEIIKIHDVLDEILNNPEVANAFDWTGYPDIRNNMIIIKRTLCWVLQHDEGRWLESNMKAVMDALAQRGFNLSQLQ